MRRGMPPPKRAAIASVADEAFDAVLSDVTVDGIEVTQVVQDMAHSVTLVAGKPTVVRVYLSRPAGGVVTLRGVIAVRRTAHGAAQLVPSLDTARLNPAQNGELRLKRENLTLSLNFLLPASLTTAGKIFVSVASLTEAATGVKVACSNCADVVRHVSFKESPPLRVRLVKMRYRTNNPPRTHLPGTREMALIESWLKRAYPVSRVLLSSVTVEANFSPPFDTGPDAEEGTCVRANAQLTAIRNLDVAHGTDHRTHYYGLVADSSGQSGGSIVGGFMRGCANNIPESADPTAVASGPTAPEGYAWDTDGSYGDWYTGHELGHTLGRKHPGFCNGNTADDSDFPFVRGQLSNADGAFVGFDIGEQSLGLPMKVMPGATWHDVMTYCARQWVCSYTYEGIRRRLLAEEALGLSPAHADSDVPPDSATRTLPRRREAETEMQQENFINVVGTVNLTKKTGRILYVNPVPAPTSPRALIETQTLIRVKNADGQTLREYAAPVKLNTCVDPGRDLAGVLDAVIAIPADAKALELVLEGRVVDTYQAAAAPSDAPTLRRSGVTGDAVTMEYDAPESDAADATAENVSYNIQVSTDDGQTWQTVAVGRRRPDVNIDRNQFPAGSRVTVRLLASDGFSNRVVDTQTFSVDEPQT